MPIKLYDHAFDPWLEIVEYQKQSKHLNGKYGAVSVFVGAMRDFNQGEQVQSLELKHYPGMTEKQLMQIVSLAEQQWSMLDHLLVHRYGAIIPDDTLVLVAVWAVHRGDAFDACRFIMEQLKMNAPFWKKEKLLNGDTRWVETNTNGYQNK